MLLSLVFVAAFSTHTGTLTSTSAHLLEGPQVFVGANGTASLLPSDEVARELKRLDDLHFSVVPGALATGVGVVGSVVAVVMLFTTSSAATIALLLTMPLVATVGLTALIATLIRNADVDARRDELEDGRRRPATLSELSRDELVSLRNRDASERRTLALPIVLLGIGAVMIPTGGILSLFGLVVSVTFLIMGPAVILAGTALLTAGILSLVATVQDNNAIDERGGRIQRASQSAPDTAPPPPPEVPGAGVWLPQRGLTLARF